jgi:hypothetical protein
MLFLTSHGRVFCVNVFVSNFRDRFQRSNFKYRGRPAELHSLLQIFSSASFIVRHRTNGLNITYSFRVKDRVGQ